MRAFFLHMRHFELNEEAYSVTNPYTENCYWHIEHFSKQQNLADAIPSPEEKNI